MRNIFIINPASGGGIHVEKLLTKIKKLEEERNVKIEYHITECMHDAEHFARKICVSNEGHEELRFFVCGGDGSLNEVLNGIVGFPEAALGVIPVGTGNDFVRNFALGDTFTDLDKQFDGETARTDIIKYTYEENGQKISKYCANMFNIGFDCNVVVVTQKVKRFPFISGHFAYLLSLLIVLIKKMGAELNITWENSEGKKDNFSGKILLTAIANGCYCGGGVKGIPLALVNDGEIDLSIIKNMSRTRLATLYKKYADGTHLYDEKAKSFFIYEKCKKLTVEPKGGCMKLCVDGEVIDAGTVEFEIVPEKMNFILPKH